LKTEPLLEFDYRNGFIVADWGKEVSMETETAKAAIGEQMA